MAKPLIPQVVTTAFRSALADWSETNLFVDLPFLPVANHPPLYYNLMNLKKNKLTDNLIFLVQPDLKEKLQKFVEHFLDNEFQPKLTYFDFDPTKMGILHALQHLKSDLMDRFVLFPGEIFGHIDLKSFAEKHMHTESMVTALMLPKLDPKSTNTNFWGGPADAKKFDVTVAYNPENFCLLKFMAKSDTYTLELTHDQMVANSEVTLASQLNNAHIYVLDKEITTLPRDPFYKKGSITDELIPLLTRFQTSASRDESLLSNLKKAENKDESTTASLEQLSNSPVYARACFQTPEQGYCVRLCNQNEYKEFHTFLCGLKPSEFRQWVPTYLSTLEKSSGKMVKKCLVDELAKVDATAQLTKTTVAKNSKVGPSTKLENCLVMEGAVVEEGAKLKNCTLYPNSTVGKNCTLENASVGSDFTVEENFTGTGLLSKKN